MGRKMFPWEEGEEGHQRDSARRNKSEEDFSNKVIVPKVSVYSWLKQCGNF